jgi:hypothetical protein
MKRRGEGCAHTAPLRTQKAEQADRGSAQLPGCVQVGGNVSGAKHIERPAIVTTPRQTASPGLTSRFICDIQKLPAAMTKSPAKMIQRRPLLLPPLFGSDWVGATTGGRSSALPAGSSICFVGNSCAEPSSIPFPVPFASRSIGSSFCELWHPRSHVRSSDSVAAIPPCLGRSDEPIPGKADSKSLFSDLSPGRSCLSCGVSHRASRVPYVLQPAAEPRRRSPRLALNRTDRQSGLNLPW